jgi:hypothetical protein
VKIARNVALVVLAVGAALLVATFFAYRGTQSFIAESQPAQALVMEVTTSSSSGMRGKRFTHYRYRLRFATSSGDALEATAAQSSSGPEYQRGEIVPVRYLKSDPKVVEIEALRFIWLDVILLGVFSAAALVAGLGALWVSTHPGRNPTPRVAACFVIPPAVVGLTLMALFANVVVQVIFFGFLAFVAIDVARRRRSAGRRA